MPRTHYTAADLERLSCNVKDVETIFTFRNEQLLNLFLNEMQGQISDGMWENSRHTDWLWKNVIYRLGQETKVEVFNSWNIGRKSYPLVKELWDVIGYRLYGEQDETTAGYQTEREARAAWRELNLAIYNVTILPKDDLWRTKKSEADDIHRKAVQSLRNRSSKERMDVVGNEYGGIYLDQENRKDYVSISTTVRETEYWFIINKAFRVEMGHLAEGLEELRNMYRNTKSVRIISAY